MTFLDGILADLKRMDGEGLRRDADDRLISVVLYFAGALMKDQPDWTAKAAEIVTAYRDVSKRYE